MQALVYTFIALAALGAGVSAYWGLGFTPADAILLAVVFGSVCVLVMERALRQRAELRLERAIEELSRLLATDAQAGAVLGQRINAMSDLNSGPRLENLEADISVLGTVIRQVAEAVSEVEEKLAKGQTPPARQRLAPIAQAPGEPEPTIPLNTVRQALGDNRLVFHIQPVVRLPQRRPQGYDLVPRLMLESGDLADRADFLPRRGGEDVQRHIEGHALLEAITIGRRTYATGQQTVLYIPLSRASLSDTTTAEQLVVSLEANRAIAPGLIFTISDADWQTMTTGERHIADAMAKRGASFSLADVRSLRVDVAELSARGVRSLRIDAPRFLSDPESFTDFHSADIADYINRYEVALLATNIGSENQIVELLDDRILLAQGLHIAAPGPLRHDLAVEPSRATPQLRRAER